jgi:hypothetical protein
VQPAGEVRACDARIVLVEPMIAHPPSAWADAERRFHAAYLRDSSSFPRTAVVVSWTTHKGATGAGAAGLLGMAASAWRNGAAHHDGVEVTVRRSEDLARSMAFSIDPGPEPLRPSGSSTGILVGGFDTHAITCLEVDGRLLWPTMNPIER